MYNYQSQLIRNHRVVIQPELSHSCSTLVTSPNPENESLSFVLLSLGKSPRIQFLEMLLHSLHKIQTVMLKISPEMSPSTSLPPSQIPPGHSPGNRHEGLLNIIATMAPIIVNIHQMAWAEAQEQPDHSDNTSCHSVIC